MREYYSYDATVYTCRTCNVKFSTTLPSPRCVNCGKEEQVVNLWPGVVTEFQSPLLDRYQTAMEAALKRARTGDLNGTLQELERLQGPRGQVEHTLAPQQREASSSEPDAFTDRAPFERPGKQQSPTAYYAVTYMVDDQTFQGLHTAEELEELKRTAEIIDIQFRGSR